MIYNRYANIEKRRNVEHTILAGMRLFVLTLLFFGTTSVILQAQDATSDTVEAESGQTEMAEEQGEEEESKSFLQKIFPFLGNNKNGDERGQTNEVKRNPYADYTLEELNEALLEQAKQQNVDELIKILEEGARINTENDHGRNALMEAARLGHIEVVKTLIRYGATLNAKDNYDGTALEYAEKEGHIDIVHILQKNGARR